MELSRRSQANYWTRKGEDFISNSKKEVSEEKLLKLNQSLEVSNAITDGDLREQNMAHNFSEWIETF